MCRLLYSIFAFVLLMSVGDAQTLQPTEPRTVAECLKSVQEYSDQQDAAARKAGRKPDFQAYQAQAKDLARQYAARFKPEEVNEAELPTLALLYLEADHYARSRTTINRRLNTASLSEVDRADALATAVVIMTKGAPDAEGIRLAEAFTAQLDTLSSAVLKQKIAAHKRLGGYYSQNDLEEEKNLGHNLAILQLIGQLPPEEHDKYARQNLSLYDRIATLYANRGLIEQARETCQQGKAEALRQGRVGADGRTVFDRSIERYSLLGKPGAPLLGAYWINGAPKTKELDLRGRVTLIQFTAHWCAPCRESYPGMLKLYQQFNRRGLNLVMATQLYGYFAKRRDLKPEAEMAANHEYYRKQLKLPFMIAVEQQSKPSDQTGAATAGQPETNEDRYFVGGIPQIVILDKQGMVRWILTGWGFDNERRATNLIEQLLKEPAVAAKQ